MNVNDSRELALRKGALLVGRKKWDEALKLYEFVQKRHGLDLTKELTQCRVNLNLAEATAAPATIVLGEAIRAFTEGVALKHDGKHLWAADGIHLRRYSSGTWIDISVPQTLEHTITSIAVTPDLVACGTDGGGLFIHDQRSNRWRQFTEGEGLLQSHIHALHAAGRRLWIGFRDGGKGTGGLGYLDLDTFKFVGMTPSLDVIGQRVVTDKSDQPPKGGVVGLIDDGNFLWVGVKGKGLQRYNHQQKIWDTATAWNGFLDAREQVIADSRNSVAAIALSPRYIAVVCDKTRGWSTGGTYWGGLSFYSVEKRKWTVIAEPHGLPINWFYSVAIDGDRLWAGGRGILAQIDMRSGRITGICKTGQAWVVSIEVGPDAVWIAVGDQLFRQPLSPN